jgi:hypothetical protein
MRVARDRQKEPFTFMQKGTFILAFTAILAATSSCRTRTEQDRRATEEAEAKAQASTTTLTSATVDASEDDAEHVMLRREQLVYRARLEVALDALDHALLKARTHARAGKIKELQGRRETLKHHVDAIDRSTAQDWASVKAAIDRDLEHEAAKANTGR